jgi:hypothetical protein
VAGCIIAPQPPCANDDGLTPNSGEAVVRSNAMAVVFVAHVVTKLSRRTTSRAPLG